MAENMHHGHIPVKHLVQTYEYAVVERPLSIDHCQGVQNLKSIREARGLTQSQLAQAVGCNQATISKAERGSSNITLDLIQRIARVLRFPEVDLFALNDLEQRYLQALREANPERRAAVLLLLRDSQSAADT